MLGVFSYTSLLVTKMFDGKNDSVTSTSLIIDFNSDEIDEKDREKNWSK